MEKPVLIVVEGPLRGQKWTMHGHEIVIGRGGNSDIVIPDRRISREHVRIYEAADGEYVVEDLDSKNGTHLNAVRLIGSSPLNEGDEIQIALCASLKFIGDEATVPLSLEDEEELISQPQSLGLVVDERTRQIIIDGQVLDPQLSLYQYRLLRFLYSKAGAVCGRDDVVQAVWPDADVEGVSEQAIDALVRRLRDRLQELAPEHQYIVTVRGHGFRLEQP